MALITICRDFGAPENKVWHCFHCFTILLIRWPADDVWVGGPQSLLFQPRYSRLKGRSLYKSQKGTWVIIRCICHPYLTEKLALTTQGTSQHRDSTLNSRPRKNHGACTSLANSRGPSAVSLELLASLRNLSTPTAGLLGSRSLPTWIELSSLQSSHTCSYDYLMIHDTKVVIALLGYKWGSLGSKEVGWPEMRLQETLSVSSHIPSIICVSPAGNYSSPPEGHCRLASTKRQDLVAKYASFLVPWWGQFQGTSQRPQKDCVPGAHGGNCSLKYLILIQKPIK